MLYWNQRGGALVFVLISLVVLMILGISLMNTAVADTRMAAYQENSMKAYFIAQSGAYTLADYIVKNPTADVAGMVIGGQTLPVTIGDGYFTLEVTQSAGEIIILSRGVVKGVEQQATVVMEMSAGAVFEYPIAAKGQISIANHVEVVGNIVTNSPHVSNKIPVDLSSNANVTGVVKNAGLKFPNIIVPDSFDEVIENKVNNNKIIYVDGEKTVYLEKGVELSNNDVFTITGNGILHLYVSNGWKSHNQAILDIGTNITLFVYILDDTAVEIRSDSFKGVLYAPLSTITVKTANKDRDIKGSLIAKEVNIDGNHTKISNSEISFLDKVKVEQSYNIKRWQ